MRQGEARSRIVSLVLDAQEPRRMARFWAEALGWRINEVDGEPVLVPTDHTGFDILFESTDEEKVGQNPIHLDMTTTSIEDQRDSVERLVAAGARHVDVGQRPAPAPASSGPPGVSDEGHVVLADPEGNELCIIEPGSSFLAGCPRLGAINADGMRATGLFWSEVLGWPMVWDQDGETAICSPDGTGPVIQWSGPPLMPRRGKNRLHLDIAPRAGVDQDDEVERLVGLGAKRLDIGQGGVGQGGVGQGGVGQGGVGQGGVAWVVMADPDDNAFCVLTPR